MHTHMAPSKRNYAFPVLKDPTPSFHGHFMHRFSHADDTREELGLRHDGWRAGGRASGLQCHLTSAQSRHHTLPLFLPGRLPVSHGRIPTDDRARAAPPAAVAERERLSPRFPGDEVPQAGAALALSRHAMGPWQWHVGTRQGGRKGRRADADGGGALQ